MKNFATLLVVLLLSIMSPAIAQDNTIPQDTTVVNFNKPKTSLAIDLRLEPYVEEFVTEALNRGFHVRFLLMEKVDYILVHQGLGTSPGDDRIGVVGMDYRGLYVSPIILDNPVKLRLTIYHELGHLIKDTGEHSCEACYDIMSEYSPQDLSPYMNEKFWALKLDEYFKWLNGE